MEPIVLPDLFKAQAVSLSKKEDNEKEGEKKASHNKNQAFTYIKAPIRPTNQPGVSKETHMPDENTWVWNLIEKLKESLSKAIKPLTDYLKTYDAYSDLAKLIPEEYMK